MPHLSDWLAVMSVAALVALAAWRTSGVVSQGAVAGALFAMSPPLWPAQANQLVPLVIVLAWLIALDQLSRSGRTAWAAAAGGVLGLGMYHSYSTAVMMSTYVVITGLAVAFGERHQPWTTSARRLATVVVVFGSVSALWAYWTLSEPATWHAEVRAHRLYDVDRFAWWQGLREITSWVGLTARVGVYWDHLSPAWLFATGPVLPMMAAPLLALGLARQPASAADAAIVLGLISAPLLSTLTAEPPVLHRTGWLILFAALAAASGWQVVLSWLRAQRR